jgi:PAS domain-containing protein
MGRRYVGSHDPIGRELPVYGRTIEDETIPAQDASCIWAVAPGLTTVFASPAFSRLVGISRFVLVGQPWFVLLPEESMKAVDWLVSTPTTRATAILDIRHLEGLRHRVVLRRIYGGPGHDKAVFRVTALERAETTIVEATVSRVRSRGTP